MSKDLWGDEPFRDGQPELNNGQWKEQDTYTPAPENVVRQARAIQKQEAQVQQEEIDIDGLMEAAAEDEDEDFTDVLSDARLRLEQGKLYEMVMNHALFDGLDADPRAVKSVQKQIRKFAKEQMEMMLGMRQEAIAVAQVSSPFSSLEARALKDIAFQLITAKNMKEEDYEDEQVVGIPNPPLKKKTLNTIGKNQIRPTPKPIAKKPEPIKRQVKPRLDLPPEMEPDYEPLSKPIHEMTAAELAERDRQATERQKNRMVITPKEQRAHWPSFEEQTMLAQAQVNRAAGGNSGMSSLNGSLSRLVMNSVNKKVLKSSRNEK